MIPVRRKPTTRAMRGCRERSLRLPGSVLWLLSVPIAYPFNNGSVTWPPVAESSLGLRFLAAYTSSESSSTQEPMAYMQNGRRPWAGGGLPRLRRPDDHGFGEDGGEGLGRLYGRGAEV